MDNSSKSTYKQEFIKENYNKLPNGQLRLKKNNKVGRFPKKLTLTYLTKLIRKDEKTYPDKKKLLEHYLERLRRNDNLLAKFMDKYLPTINRNEIIGAGGEPINFKFIVEKTYENKGNKDKTDSQAD